MIQLHITRISTFAEGIVEAEVIGTGEKVVCHFHNKDRDWDKVYDYLSRPMTVRGSIMTAGHFLIMEIID